MSVTIKEGNPVKVITINIKDDYDKQFGSMLEYGIVEPLEYYKAKKFFIENPLPCPKHGQ